MPTKEISIMTLLADVLAVMGYETDEITTASSAIGTMRRVIMVKKDILLMNSHMSPGMIDEIMYLKEWYIE